MPKRRYICEETYEPQQILARHVRNRVLEYLVAWVGYGADGDPWEPPEHLKKYQHPIAEF